MKYIIAMMDDSGDLNKHEFETREEADQFLEENEWKAILIEVDGTYKIEDHT